jgi:hypothetical protein
MDLQNLARAIVVLALVELALDVSRKTPLWLSRQSVASFVAALPLMFKPVSLFAPILSLV